MLDFFFFLEPLTNLLLILRRGVGVSEWAVVPDLIFAVATNHVLVVETQYASAILAKLNDGFGVSSHGSSFLSIPLNDSMDVGYKSKKLIISHNWAMIALH